MERTSIERAKRRLRSVRFVFAKMQGGPLSIEQFEDEWWTFLSATDSLYECLAKGARSKESAAWLDKKKHERRVDALLTYVHQARHSDYHGVEIGESADSAAVYGWRISVLTSGVRVELPHKSGSNLLEFHMKRNTGIQKFRFVYPEIKLRDVVNRGVKYKVPSKHLGKPIENAVPLVVVQLTLEYLENMIAEAEGMLK